MATIHSPLSHTPDIATILARSDELLNARDPWWNGYELGHRTGWDAAVTWLRSQIDHEDELEARLMRQMVEDARATSPAWVRPYLDEAAHFEDQRAAA